MRWIKNNKKIWKGWTFLILILDSVIHPISQPIWINIHITISSTSLRNILIPQSLKAWHTLPIITSVIQTISLQIAHKMFSPKQKSLYSLSAFLIDGASVCQTAPQKIPHETISQVPIVVISLVEHSDWFSLFPHYIYPIFQLYSKRSLPKRI